MIVVQVCVGSSCHLKGSHDIVTLMQQAIEEHRLEGDVALVGNFCIGVCGTAGVTVQVDDDVHPGITRENFKEFFAEHILKKVKEKGE